MSYYLTAATIIKNICSLGSLNFSGIGDQPTSGRPKYNIYPDPLPPPPPDDPNQPIKALGINRAANHAWDGASSHFIDFNDKNETYGRPPEGEPTDNP